MSGGCGQTQSSRSHLPVWWPVSSRSAAGWSGHSRLCCPSAGSPPGGEMEHSSAEHAPSCSEPETMATAQRHHIYVSLGWIRTVSSLIVSADTLLFACTSNAITPAHTQIGVDLKSFKHTVGFRLNSNNAYLIDHANNQKQHLELQGNLVIKWTKMMHL